MHLIHHASWEERFTIVQYCNLTERWPVGDSAAVLGASPQSKDNTKGLIESHHIITVGFIQLQ